MNDYFDGESGTAVAALENPNTSVMVQMAQAELNQAVTTARAFPRSISQAVARIKSLATLDAQAAGECVYALPRGNKPIRGPSVRFAEIIGSQWGNCQIGSRIVAVDRFEKVVIAEGVFHDLETGMKRIFQVQRRISDKNGKLFNDDMIAMTGNAACSIAMREAVLKGVPKAVWRAAYDAVERINFGSAETMVVRREKAMKAFAGFGVKPEQIFALLEVGGLDDIGLEEIATLTAMFNAIKNEEATVESFFAPKPDAATTRRMASKPPAAAIEAKPAAKKEEAKAEPEPEPKVEAKEEPKAEAEPEPKEEAKPAAAPNLADAASKLKGKFRTAGDIDELNLAWNDHEDLLDAMKEAAPDLFAELADIYDTRSNSLG